MFLFHTHTYQNYINWLGFRVNGTDVVSSYITTGNNWNNFSINAVLDLAANDNVRVYMDAGSSTPNVDSGKWGRFNGYLLG